MRVGILNATGYTGGEMIRILAGHPDLEITGLTARSDAGRAVGDVLPWTRATARPGLAELTLTPELMDSYDLVVSCLPHSASALALAPFVESGVRAVDVSADFRLKDLAAYERWYGEHAAPGLIDSSVYGLTEFRRDEVRACMLVANPGCHAITAQLALYPALAAGLVDPHVTVDSKTGISGAGRTSKPEFGFSEINENVAAYNVAAHRHVPEIEQELSAAAGTEVTVTFVPHLIPMTRGILVTAYAALRAGAGPDDVSDAYDKAYAREPFVHVIDRPPSTKWVAGGNHCFVHAVVDEPGRSLIAFAATDNLGKGAAGAAVQNANVMLNLAEDAGLGIPPSFP